MAQPWKLIILVLFLTSITIWLAVFAYPAKRLRLIACDVGQGDAILAVYGDFQILTDGGIPNGKVLACISRYIPFWDREIEVVVNTHPQLDHYGGLIEVFKRYKVDYFVANALDSSASEYQALKSVVGSRGIKVINPTSGTSIRYGLISYDIFWPSESFLRQEGYDFKNGRLGTFTTKRDPNDFSVQAILTFGNFDALLTGDIGHNMADEVIDKFDIYQSTTHNSAIEYLKIPHHGSKYGITGDYLSKINPEFAVISVGAKNSYGHPTQEILEILNEKNIKILRTDLEGDVVISIDGNTFELI